MANPNGYQPHRVPVQPFQRALEARGGWPQVADRCGLPEAVRANLRAKYSNGIQSGRLTIKAADELCLDILGCLPQDIWGAEWWAA